MNQSTKVLVTVFGIIFGISGMSHGLFEVLQGNAPTGGAFISAIGEAQRMWPHGNEYALTLIPNFQITGLAALILGFSIIVWSVGFVHKKSGSLVFFLLFVALLLAGGGIAQILFFPPLALVSTRIHGPLSWWKKAVPDGLQKGLSRIWAGLLAVSALLLLCVLGIAVTGYVPAVGDPETALSIMLACLCGVMVTLPLAVVAGFSRDLAARPDVQ